MKGLSFCRAGICLLVAGGALYSYLAEQNRVMTLSMEVPAQAKELRELSEERDRLRYQIEQFESPLHLIELAKSAEYSHLKHPIEGEIVELAAYTLPVREVPLEETRHHPLMIVGAK